MLSTQVIEKPAQVAYGPVGTTASDAQVQATLSMSLTASPSWGLRSGRLSIPLFRCHRRVSHAQHHHVQ